MSDKVSSEGLMYAYMLTGDNKAFSALHVRHSRILLAWLTKKVGPTSAQDILQNVWLKVARKADTYSVTKGKFGAWIGFIARNELYDHLRACRRKPTEELKERHLSGFETVGAVHARMDVERTMAHMSPEGREVLTRAYIWGQSGEEIATCMGVSDVSARGKIHRAKKAYKEIV